MYTGSLALQDMNGFTRIVINRSLSPSIVRAAMIPGTLHPNPISIGMNAFPGSPMAYMSRSMMNAARAR
ncbi:hypothetical protein DSECCO2_500680 [anaerobic digester metagenome]